MTYSMRATVFAGNVIDGETKMLMMPKLVLFTVRRHLAGPSDERGLGAATK